MGNGVFDKEFYDNMKKHMEKKGVKCESTKVFSDVKRARSATFTLMPHETPLAIRSRI